MNGEVICNMKKLGKCKDVYCLEGTPHVAKVYRWPSEIACTEEQGCKRAGFKAGVKCVPVVEAVK